MGKRSVTRRSGRGGIPFQQTVVFSTGAGGTSKLSGNEITQLPGGRSFTPQSVVFQIATSAAPALVQCYLFDGAANDCAVSSVMVIPQSGKRTVRLSWALSQVPFPENWAKSDKFASVVHICTTVGQTNRIVGTMTFNARLLPNHINEVCPKLLPEYCNLCGNVLCDQSMRNKNLPEGGLGIGCTGCGHSSSPPPAPLSLEKGKAVVPAAGSSCDVRSPLLRRSSSSPTLASATSSTMSILEFPDWGIPLSQELQSIAPPELYSGKRGAPKA